MSYRDDFAAAKALFAQWDARHREQHKPRYTQPRREVCRHGHLKTDDNVIIQAGHRHCKTCRRQAQWRAYRLRVRAKAQPTGETCLVCRGPIMRSVKGRVGCPPCNRQRQLAALMAQETRRKASRTKALKRATQREAGQWVSC